MQKEIEEYKKRIRKIAKSAYKKELLNTYRQHGICTICGREDADEGMSSCGKCRSKRNFMKIVNRIALGLPVRPYDPYPEEEKFEWEMRNCRNCGKLFSTNEDCRFCSTECLRSYYSSGKAGKSGMAGNPDEE